MKILFIIIQIVNSLVPKSSHKIIFISRPDFSDNAKHMYSYMQKKSPQHKLSWLIYDKEIHDILIENGHKNIFYLKSISGVWEYLRSRTIISSSSSLWQIKSPLQRQFDLWHGIPLKNVLCMGEKGVIATRQAGNITMRFATSTLEKALLSASFDFNAMKIEVTGQPRTDPLFSKEKNLSQLLNEDVSKYKKVILYMPTYRHGYREKSEGNAFDVDNIFRFNSYDREKFLNFLKENNILFLLKLHPFEEKLHKSLPLGDNIKWITNETLVKNNLTIYDLFYEVDTLVTDYSSVYFDFLLTDKKIIFMPLDLEYYKSNRGFQLEPYEFWTPGKKVFNQEDFQDEILNDDNTNEKELRKVVRDIMFSYQDDQSASRVYDSISEYIQVD